MWLEHMWFSMQRLSESMTFMRSNLISFLIQCISYFVVALKLIPSTCGLSRDKLKIHGTFGCSLEIIYYSHNQRLGHTTNIQKEEVSVLYGIKNELKLKFV